MYQKLKDLKRQKVAVLHEYYDGEIDKLRVQCREALTGLRREAEIRNEGWKAFEDCLYLHDNPYSPGNEPNEWNWWKEGWEMGHENAVIEHNVGLEYVVIGQIE